jgi:outer membrane protein assembly factor BamA
VVDPIERWQLTNLENSLAFFLFRRDYRDYYEREGWYGQLGWRYRAFSGGVEFVNENHRSLAARSPWTILFNTDDDYRTNAAIDGAELHSLTLTLGIDTRNHDERPSQGWYNSARIERGLGGDLNGDDADFTHYFLDLRRYNRVSRSSVLALRWVSGGRIGNELLPAQRQHVLGGAGSLPGYDQLEFDCGRRTSSGFGTLPGYGCQRFALFQAEYRSGLDFDFHWDETQVPGGFDGDVFSVEFEPSVVLFYDAGTAWSSGEGFFDHLTTSDNWVADVGGGLDFGGLGLYVAYPLVGSGGLNFLVRLTGRF